MKKAQVDKWIASVQFSSDLLIIREGLTQGNVQLKANKFADTSLSAYSSNFTSLLPT